MKKKRLMLRIGLVVSLGAAWILLPGQTPEKESDPVKLTPHMYQVRLENAYVRVLEYRSEPGEKEPMHFHPPGVVYYLSDGTMRVTDRQGHAEEHHLNAGEVTWRNKTWHAAENTGKTEVHALAVELKMPLEDLK
jgi:beta-alanine degradation protein BauB